MFDRFTDRARKVMGLARQEAQRFNHQYIGTEHILLGLIQEGSGVAANVLRNLDVDPEKIRVEVEKIVERKGNIVSIPVNTPGMTPVHDSLQMNLSDKLTDEQVQKFLDECATHGLPVELFGHKTNARNFVNWGFAPAEDPLPLTAKMLKRAVDVRLPLMWDDEDFSDMVDVICESLDAATSDQDLQ